MPPPMPRAVKYLLFMTILAGLGGGGYFFGYPRVQEYWKNRNRPKWKLASVEQGSVLSVVNSTGTVKPVQTVQIGSFVSGPIDELHVDFNDEVRKDDLLAVIDPKIYIAGKDRDLAQLKTRQADVLRVKALLQQAKNDERRALALRTENERFISQAEIDQVSFNRESLEAQLQLAEAAVEQAQAALDNSIAQLDYAKIRSPVDGIIIDKKADRGQTLAAQFQTPELFTIGVGMREKMHVFALVDEADIGLIRQAKDASQPVQFTVDAYPDDLFTGIIEQIRISSSTTQNVVTYPVVVGAPNAELKLLPGMTADISFLIDERRGVVKVPNSALRYFPLEKHVRPEDRTLLSGIPREESDTNEVGETQLSALERSSTRKNRNRRHVWVVEGDFLRGVEIVTGLNDSKFTEMVSGDLAPGQQLVIGIEVDVGRSGG